MSAVTSLTTEEMSESQAGILAKICTNGVCWRRFHAWISRLKHCPYLTKARNRSSQGASMQLVNTQQVAIARCGYYLVFLQARKSNNADMMMNGNNALYHAQIITIIPCGV